MKCVIRESAQDRCRLRVHPVEEALRSGRPSGRSTSPSRPAGAAARNRGLARARGSRSAASTRERSTVWPRGRPPGVVAAVEARRTRDLDECWLPSRARRRCRRRARRRAGPAQPRGRGPQRRLTGAAAVSSPKDRATGVTPVVEKSPRAAWSTSMWCARQHRPRPCAGSRRRVLGLRPRR